MADKLPELIKLLKQSGGVVDPNMPSIDQVAANKSDTVDLTNGLCRGLLLDADGDVAIVNASGRTITLPMSKGFNPYAASRVLVTGTDAALTIFAIY